MKSKNFLCYSLLILSLTIGVALNTFNIASAAEKIASPSPKESTESQRETTPLLVEYKTTKEINKKIGFDPLYMPRFFGYDISSMYVIGEKIADLHFKSRLDDGMLTVRTANRYDTQLDDITGLVNVEWEEKEILNTKIFFVKTADNLTVARWITKRYAFAVAFKDLDEKTMINSLKGLIRITQKHYSR